MDIAHSEGYVNQCIELCRYNNMYTSGYIGIDQVLSIKHAQLKAKSGTEYKFFWLK